MSQANSTNQNNEEQKGPDIQEQQVLRSQSHSNGNMRGDENNLGPSPIIIDITDPFSLEPEYKNVQEDVNTPAQKQASSPKNIKKDEPGLLGISSSHSPNPGGRTFNYEEKYADEPLGEELKENSRVFKVYLDEAESFDDDMMRGFRETIDSLLVFAALFSGVVTSFVIETISALQPDYSQITAVLLVEQVQILRAAGNSTAINTVPKSNVNLQNASVATEDLWINGLFLASLSLVLATALLSVLVKQWIQAYSFMSAGSAKHRALVRQFRYAGLVKWKVTEIVGILPDKTVPTGQ
ncbi:Integrin-linked protein kinase [Lentinula edodes]|uniref:Integrin-linked protein kinase n=1 Tax=Lentinula edodes TaxID=5353 RepID=A0A1Q3DYL9_LENED|nr:Integrin-linked protein kinase [Lentinula edodes]